MNKPLAFQVYQSIAYLKFVSPYPAFQLRINDVEGAGRFNKIGNRFPVLNAIYTGIFIVLTIIHLGLFLVFGKQKANLFFSMATLPGLLPMAYFSRKTTNINFSKQTLEQEVAERTVELKQSLTDLKATQAQLIQSEKLASLGELTAGIAHEIQNPLNFVNNSSEVNTEMIEEIKQEIDKGNIEEAKSILSDIKENQQKITITANVQMLL